jgi:hypothetical protein
MREPGDDVVALDRLEQHRPCRWREVDALQFAGRLKY